MISYIIRMWSYDEIILSKNFTGMVLPEVGQDVTVNDSKDNKKTITAEVWLVEFKEHKGLMIPIVNANVIEND